MRVYVKNLRNEPLMPTTPQKARKLLKREEAKVIQRTPFTIQLLYPTGENKQDISLGSMQAPNTSVCLRQPKRRYCSKEK